MKHLLQHSNNKALLAKKTVSNHLDFLSLIATIFLVAIQLKAYQQLHDNRLYSS